MQKMLSKEVVEFVEAIGTTNLRYLGAIYHFEMDQEQNLANIGRQ